MHKKKLTTARIVAMLEAGMIYYDSELTGTTECFFLRTRKKGKLLTTSQQRILVAAWSPYQIRIKKAIKLLKLRQHEEEQ